jgi:hypothetical protein
MSFQISELGEQLDATFTVATNVTLQSTTILAMMGF